MNIYVRAQSALTTCQPRRAGPVEEGVTRVAVGLILLALLLPAVAPAKQRTLTPPGDSSVSQYLETIPTAAGPSPPGGGNGHGSGALSGPARRRLLSHGAQGRLLATLVNTTAPSTGAPPSPASHRAATGAHRPGGGTTTTAAQRSGTHAAGGRTPLGNIAGESPASFILSAATGGDGGGGLGIFLPGLLLAAAIAAGAGLLGRRQRTHRV